MKIQLNFIKGLALLAVAVSLTSTASAGVVYDNTLNYRTNFFFPTPNSREFGDQINLSTDGSLRFDRVVTKFEFEYFATNITGLAETLTFRLYSSAGSNSAPILQLTSVGPIGLQNGQNTVTLDGLAVPVPGDSLHWTVQFNGITSGQAGLPIYYPPTVGSSFDDFWQNTDTGWAQFRYPGGVPEGSFAARVTAVPEPTTLAYGAIAGLLIAGRRWLRRNRQ